MISNSLSECLHIRANDIAHPADLGVTVDFIERGLSLPKSILESLDCHIVSDFVTKLEAIGDSFGSGIDADGNTLNLVILDSLGQRWS